MGVERSFLLFFFLVVVCFGVVLLTADFDFISFFLF